MAEETFPVNNLLATAKSREVQPALLADMRGDRGEPALHFLAAAHMELVLAADYERAQNKEMAFRSQLSAGSCLWRGGRSEQARDFLESLANSQPDRKAETEHVLAELDQDYPAKAS